MIRVREFSFTITYLQSLIGHFMTNVHRIYCLESDIYLYNNLLAKLTPNYATNQQHNIIDIFYVNTNEVGNHSNGGH